MYTFPGMYTGYYLPFYKYNLSSIVSFPPDVYLLLIYLWIESDMHSASLILMENDTV